MWKIITLLATSVLCACAASTGIEKPERPPGAVYTANGVGLEGVEQGLADAAADDKRLLVVLGADWCHDSRALAEHLQTEPLASLVAGRYELRLVDVGYLDRGADVLQRLGVEQIYATPTVLVVDPSSQALVNALDRHQWGSASKIDLDEAVEYFRRMADAPAPLDPAAGLPPDYTKAVLEYQQAAADHVARGYARVGPMLRAYKAGAKPVDFESQWEEVATFRKSVPQQVEALWKEAHERTAAGDSVANLSIPEISPWSWQGED